MAAKTENAGVNLYINTKGAEASMKELKDDARKLRNELNNLSESDPRFDQVAKNLQKVSDRTEQLNNKVKGTSKAWEFMKSQVVQFGILAAGFLGFQMLIGQIDNLVKSNYKLSDSFADIRKTTGLTQYEVERLNKELGQLNTRTATKELRDMAVVAGQLGYSSKKDILDFVKSVDMLNVALGDEFQGGAEQLSKEFGALGRNFKEFKDQKPSDTVLLLGNAINELSASGAATGPIMSDFANRIGGIGGALGLTAGETLGLSATLEELNITAERGGTAVGKILQKMTTNVSEFAEIAGMEVQDFNKMLNEDLYGAFVQVVKGSQESGSSATALAKVLKDAELQGSGASEVFLKLGNNTDLLSKRVNLANESLTNTNSITNEFNIKNNNFAANVDKIGKAFAGWFVNGSIMAGLNTMVELLGKAVEPVKDLSAGLREEEAVLRSAQSAMSVYFSILKDTTASTAEKNIAMETLNKNYGEYLPNLITEKTSVTELNKIQAEANDLLIKKIVLKSKEAELTEITNKRIEDEKELIQRENELVDYKVKAASTVDPNVRKYIEYLKDRTSYLKAEIEKSKAQVQAVDQEYAALKIKMGIKDEAKTLPIAEEVTKKPVKDFVDDTEDKKAQKAEEKYMKWLRNRQEMYQKSLDEEEKLSLDFEERLEEQQAKQAQEAFQRHLAQIDLDAETEKAVLDEKALDRYEQSRAWMEFDAMAMLEAEQARVNAIYQIERQAIADKLALYNLENDQTGAIRQSLNNRLLVLDNANRRNEIEGEKEKVRLKQALREKDFVAASAVIGNFGKLNAAFMSLAGGDQKEFIAFQKGITLAQIAVDTAKAISSLTSASAANPTNAVTYGAAGAAQFVAGLATILANVAQAKQLLSAPEPSAPSFGGGTDATAIPKFKVGGNTAIANPGGYYNSPGLFIAAEAGGEWIGSNPMITDPNYKGIFQALEADRVKYFAGGGNSNSTAPVGSLPSMFDQAQVVNAVMSLHAGFQSLADRINAKPVTLSLYELDKAESLKAEIKAAARIG
jgi:TP901 family phage tail tape measure protein